MQIQLTIEYGTTMGKLINRLLVNLSWEYSEHSKRYESMILTKVMMTRKKEDEEE